VAWTSRTPAYSTLSATRSVRVVLSACALLLVLGAPAAAQTVEITPLAGYRFGNDFFEAVANRPVDLDGAPVVGGMVNVDLGQGLSFEGLFSHQQAHVTVPADPFGPAASWRVVVDQWLAGGRQEFGAGRARPYLSGLLGLTWFGTDGDHELRFTTGAGGGLKVPLQRRLGLRLDSRVLATFLDVEAQSGVCGAAGCVLHVHANVVWQAEFTADVVVVF
jgi:hypothetical protein